jgi:opacity protein-like surface antigen
MSAILNPTSQSLIALIALIAVAAARPPLARAEALEGNNSIIPKFGTYAMSKSSQNLRVYGDETCFIFCGFPSRAFPLEIEQASREVVGIEYEYRTKWGFSLGGDVLHTSNKYTTSLINPSTGAFVATANGELNVNHRFVMIKKYFAMTERFRPFVGTGLGYTDARLSGGVNQRAHGLSLQFAGGFHYRIGSRIGIRAEYRHIVAPGIELDGGEVKTGQIFGDLNLSGQGTFVGVSAHF